MTAANKLELLQIVESVARDKNIDKELIFQAMEEAMARGARQRFGHENDIRVTIDRKTGDSDFKQYTEVVEHEDIEPGQVNIKLAKITNPDAVVGDMIIKQLPPIDIGRIAAQSAKQIILQKVREAERDRQHDDYIDKVGQIINGTYKRKEYGNVIIDVGGAEAVLRYDQMIPRETFHSGDRVRAYIYDVKREKRGPQIFLSRTKPEFMHALFKQEVPEIYEGIIEIVAIARDPGSRAKIAVTTSNSTIDPVGACVGMRGSRVQAVVNELRGEKIDIIPWSNDPASFIVQTLVPAEISKVVLDEESERIEVIVPDEQLKLAIGRHGQNVQLASKLSGWKIDIMTDSQESEKSRKEFQERTELFCNALNIDEVIAQYMAAEGFSSIEEVAFVDKDELLQIEGFEEDTVKELQSRAQEYLEEYEEKQENLCKKMGVSDLLLQIDGMRREYMITLGNNEIFTLENFADCARDELNGWKERGENGPEFKPGILSNFKLSDRTVEAMILQARRLLNWIEPEEKIDDIISIDAQAVEQDAQAVEQEAQAVEQDAQAVEQEAQAVEQDAQNMDKTSPNSTAHTSEGNTQST